MPYRGPSEFLQNNLFYWVCISIFQLRTQEHILLSKLFDSLIKRKTEVYLYILLNIFDIIGHSKNDNFNKVWVLFSVKCYHMSEFENFLEMSWSNNFIFPNLTEDWGKNLKNFFLKRRSTVIESPSNFLLFNLLISFSMTLVSVCWKQKIPEITFFFMDLTLGFSLNFSMAILVGLFLLDTDVLYPLISKFLTSFLKNWLKWSDSSLSLGIIYHFLLVYFLDLLVPSYVRSGLTNLYNSLLSAMYLVHILL